MAATTQRWLFCTCTCLLWISASSAAFVPFVWEGVVVSPTKTFMSSSSTSSSTTSAATDYDIVNVDLADGRDYPIYIGAGFSDDEGECVSMKYLF